MAVTALMLIPMLVFTAFATDVGAWYVRAQQIQRAADAAALAAVVWMPDETRAATVAVDVAARNGFVDQPGDFDDPDVDLPQVQVTQVGTQRVRVDIRAEGDLYFGSVIESFESPEITRFATAEYILPVPMGNPTSALGTGNVGGSTENLWLAVNGWCTGRQQGDHISARYEGVDYVCDDGPYSSSMTTPNPQYDADGYFLILDFPENSATQAWNVQFYDPGVCDIANEANGNDVVNSFPVDGVRLDTTLYYADDTPLDDYDNVDSSNVAGTRHFSQTACGWRTAYTVNPADPRGRWVLNVRSLPDPDEYGLNYFGVRVTPVGSPSAVCSTAGGANLDSCPQISAREWLPIYIARNDKNGNTILTPGASASFYLARVDEVHAGKTLEITLFDPGEGMDNLQIVAPDLTRPAFTYHTIDVEEGVDTWYGPSGETYWSDIGETSNDTCYVSGSDAVTPSAGTYRCLDVSNSAFQNRTIRIELDIPAGYTCATDCWWRIRYAPEGSGSVTDRTVWSTRVTGDPVRLVE